MEGETAPSLSEALTRFVAAKKGRKKAQDGHQELGRFVAWCGRERKAGDLSPSEVADYAQHIGLGGTDSAQRLNPVKLFLAYLKEEGLVQIGLAAHLRVPRSRRTTTGRKGDRPGGNGAFPESARLSKEGYDLLQARLDSLKEERVSVVEDIRLAMADKDFRENAPLDAAKERQGMIESQIRDLEDSLSKAQLIDSAPKEPRQRVALGAKITLKDLASGKKMVYTLVDVREADIAAGKISNVSPIGQAIQDRNLGDEVVINVPRGTVRYLIQEIGN